MNIEDYATEARKTDQAEGGLAYAALGLVGEATEYLQDPTADELGDVLWYIVAIADEIGYSLTEIANLAPSDDTVRADLAMVCSAGRVAEHVKKHLGKGEELHDHRRLLIAQELSRTYWLLTYTCATLGWSFAEVASSNVAKLRARQAQGAVLR